MRDRNKLWFLAVVQWIRQHMDDAGQGSRRGEYAQQGDGVAFREQPAFDTGRTEYLGRVAWTAGNRARLDTGEVVSLNDVVVVPSPEEIAEGMAAARASWSDETKERRWMAHSWELRKSKRVSGVQYFDADSFGEVFGWRGNQEECSGGWRKSCHRSLLEQTSGGFE